MSEPNHPVPARRSFKNNPGGPPALNNRMLRMIELMVFGPEDDPSRTPCSLEDACRAVGYQRRAGRALFQLPIFRAEYDRQLDALRRGEHARCLRTMVKIRDTPGSGKAADRKVQLDASKAIMGEEAAKGTTVNVQVNNAITPGYVIDLTEPEDRVPASGGGD